MKTHNGISIAAGLLAIAALLPGAAGAEAILHGRVSFDTGGVLIKGVEESDWTDASVNTLVLPNDTLWVDNGGTAEVEFSGGTFLRMADGSKAEIVSLPPNGTIRGWVGSFYLHRLNRSQGDFVFQTPAGAIEIEKDAMVRVDVLEEGITTVSTRWGRATVRTDAGGTVYAYAGKRVFIETGLLPSEPVPFDRSDEDAFDRWNRERAEYLATGSTQTPVEISNDTLGVTDLDRYGEWVTIDSRPVWRPTVVVDYTPYRYGYWNHVGRVGNVWVGNYPFSYITSHYGYWDHSPRYGWVWSYDRVWSPAWCATVRYGDYFVWSPINRYHRPVYPTTSAYFSIGGVSFGYFGTSIAHVNHLYSGPGYVHFANHDPFRRYYGSGNVNINIWNINTGSRRPHVRVPYRDDSVFTVRDYTPRRSIRGSSTLYASNRSASDRVQRLESSTRNSFSRGGRTGSEFVRTDTARVDRGNRTRNVRLTESTPEYSRASRSNPVVASSTRERSTTETAARTSGARDRQDSTRGGTVTTRGGDDFPGIERGVRTSTRGASGDRDSTTSTSNRTRSRSTGGSDSSPSRTGRTEARSDFDETPLRMHTRPTTRTSVPRGSESAPTASDRSGVRASTSESGRTTTRSSASSTRTQVRESSPRVTVAPDRVTTRGSSSGSESAISRSRSTTTTRPSVSSSRSTSTRLSTPSPSSTNRTQVNTPSRSSNSDSRSRVIERNTPSTSRSYTAPSRDSGSSRSYTPPTSSRSSSSSRSYTAPSRDSSSSRSYTAPSRSSSSSRSNTAPSRNSSSSRSYTAPSRDSGNSRSYTPPTSSRSSSSSRSYTAPSRDSSSSRSYTAPSRSSSGRDSGVTSRSSGSRSVSSGRSSSRGR